MKAPLAQSEIKMISKEFIDIFACHGAASCALHDKIEDRQNRIKMLFSKTHQSASLVLESLNRLNDEDFFAEVIKNFTMRGDESARILWPNIIDECQPNYYQERFHPEPKTNVVTAFDTVVEENAKKEKESLQIIPEGVWYVIFTDELIEVHYIDEYDTLIFNLEDMSLTDIDNAKPDKTLAAIQAFMDVMKVIGDVIYVAVSKTSTAVLETFSEEVEDQYPERDLKALEADIGRKPFNFHFNVPD